MTFVKEREEWLGSESRINSFLSSDDYQLRACLGRARAHRAGSLYPRRCRAPLANFAHAACLAQDSIWSLTMPTAWAKA